jgi:hypothetical protein
MLSRSLLLLSLPLLTLAHFELVFPASRGTDDENQASFPCGGYSQSQNRTLVPLTSIPVALNLGHTEGLIQITLAIGNEVGSSFNYELLPTIREMGPGDFCLPSLAVPSDLNITDGTNATIQVITNSHDGSGLYNVRSKTRITRSLVTFSTPSPSFFHYSISKLLLLVVYRTQEKLTHAVTVRRYHIHVHRGRVTVGLYERDGYKRDTTCGKRVHLCQ